jgi:hypothetical protein
MNHSSSNLSKYSLINDAERNLRSDNDKADLISQKLEHHAIALQILSKYPDAMKEYVNAVRNGTAIPPAPQESNLVIS